MIRKIGLSLSAMLALVVSHNAMAANIADAAITQFTTDGTDTMTAVGLAIVGVAVVAVLFKWVKGALFS